ncbi:MAG TPA: GNAT family N-acetyltransferase [Symbiobacteriaceae bacterium]|nr:GNAT family N-acetyltransferase [Symbiobacteriaceae bacterium]
MSTLWPAFETHRLALRPFEITDAEAVCTLAGDPRVSATLANVPHPYSRDEAERWIKSTQEALTQRERFPFAVVRKSDAVLIGCMSLIMRSSHRQGELAYWVGRPFWGQGYATEAGSRLIAFGFAELKLHRIAARHMGNNPASGRVMQKLGMTYEGTLRQDILKDGVFQDTVVYGLLCSEFPVARK